MDVNYFERKCKENKNLPINEIMSKVAFMVGEEDPIIKAAALMVVNKIQSLLWLETRRLLELCHAQSC